MNIYSVHNIISAKTRTQGVHGMDFLSNRSDAAIRKEIRGIRDSYHHYWDLLAELLQNSRDAINRKKKAGGLGPFFIHLEIDSSSNTVTALDNGIGIHSTKIHEMLAPGGGDKDGSGREVGEKGVGLTYAVFSGNNFSITSRVAGEVAYGGAVTGAQNWLNDYTGSNKPIFSGDVNVKGLPENQTLNSGNPHNTQLTYPLDSYTKISVGSIVPSDDTSIFLLTAQQLKILILSRTAAGVTHQLFNQAEALEFDFYLTTNLSTGSSTSKIDSTYIKPHELVTSSNRIPLQTVRDAFVSKNDASAKRKYLGSKTVYISERRIVDGWAIDVYGVMFPDNDTFKQLSKSALSLFTSDEDETEGATLFQSGIFVGTKGMPTGMKIEPKPGGRYPAYYKRCFFLVESPDLKFDLGRKFLHYKYVRRLQTAVSEVFSKFEDIAIYQGDARATPTEAQKTSIQRKLELQEEWASAKGLAELGEPNIQYAKIPNNQEAAVSAVFHELLGAGIIKGYKSLKTGYSARYDLHATYTSPDGQLVDTVIEFKHSLDSLIKDLQEKQKNFSEINLLIAWDADEQTLKNAGFELDSIPSGFFAGATHTLTVPVPGIEAIEVILLRAFFDRRKSST